MPRRNYRVAAAISSRSPAFYWNAILKGRSFTRDQFAAGCPVVEARAPAANDPNAILREEVRRDTI